MKKISDYKFYQANACELAQNLIGKWIETNIDNKRVIAQICETEAYLGVDDSASHVYKGKRTTRTEPMWDEGGTIYIYLCYGLHYMLNITSGKNNDPQAVLIRGVVGAVGPARTTKLLNIDKRLNAKSIINNPEICVYDDGNKYKFTTDKRVGIDYALPKDRDAKLRYILVE